MSDLPPKLRRAVRASSRVREAEARLESARAAFYETLRDAREAGYSISEVARALNVTRQAVQQILKRRAR